MLNLSKEVNKYKLHLMIMADLRVTRGLVGGQYVNMDPITESGFLNRIGED